MSAKTAKDMQIKPKVNDVMVCSNRLGLQRRILNGSVISIC